MEVLLGQGSVQEEPLSPAHLLDGASITGTSHTVNSYLFLAAALVVLRRLIQEARLRYRWPTRPTARRLK